VLLSLAHYSERPGLDLIEDTDRSSVWSLPREWAQSIQPEVARLIGYVDDHARSGTTVAVTRDHAVYPFAYVGWPDIEHRIVYADALTEAARRGAQWAVLPDSSKCADGWRRSLHSAPWAVWNRDPAAHCS
jgi:hypothetical protein